MITACKGASSLRILMIDRIVMWQLAIFFIGRLFAISSKGFSCKVSYKNPSPACLQ